MARPIKRARAAKDKQQRRDAFLGAAYCLFAEGDYSRVTMSQIAAHAGLSKGTVYLYFKSKEALFLELLVLELQGWFSELVPALELMRGQPGLAQVFAQGFVHSLRLRPQLVRLLALLHLVLESNLDTDAARDFKLRLSALMLPVGALIESVLCLNAGAGMKLLLHAHALVVGLSQMTDPRPAIAAVLQEPELLHLRLDFHQELERALTYLVQGQSQCPST